MTIQALRLSTQLWIALLMAAALGAQEPPKAPVQSNEPSVSSLSDVKPGIPRTAVLAGLASDYVLSKLPLPEEAASLGFENWVVTSKQPPYRTATISFAQGRTTSIQYSLFTSESPEVAKFVDTLQSAIYSSASLPTSELALEQVREMKRRYDPSGGAMTNPDITAGVKAQLELWKSMNQRFALAGVAASQGHNEVGDMREFTIQFFVGGSEGRTFHVQLLNVNGRATVYLSEIRK